MKAADIKLNGLYAAKVTVFASYFGECGCEAPRGFADTMGATIQCPECGDGYRTADSGYFYAFGFPGCLWDSEPVGPFDTEAGAVEAAREGD